MKKILSYLLLVMPLASCSIHIDEPVLPPPPPVQPEAVTNIRVGGPTGGIAAVVVDYELRAGSYYGPTLAVVEGNYIYEAVPPKACLGYIDGPYILNGPYGNPVAFIDGPYIATSPTGPTLAYMDGSPDNIAGGLGAIYMLLYY